MTGVARPRRAPRAALPALYLVVAMVAAVLILPSALRPPPDPANTTGALNPNAPPDQKNPNQILESLQEAGGGGAGASTVGSTVAPKAAPTTTQAPKAALGYCYGDPPRQIPSVYAGPCVGAWQGNNGGATSKNVFPNEIRIGFDNLGAPDTGRLKDPSTNNGSTNSQTITWQVLMQYFNSHYQFYNRKIVPYGLPEPSASTADSEGATAALAYNTDQLFAMDHTKMDVCEDFVAQGLVAFCDPLAQREYLNHRPGLFSGIYMSLDEMFGFGAEFVCKSLKDKPAAFGGADVNGKPRKFGFVTYQGPDGGAPASSFATALHNECGVPVETVTLNGQADTQGTGAAIARLRVDGVTSVIFSLPVVDILLLMEDASLSAYHPEWVMIGNYAIDNNTIATALPKDQTAHMFGISSLEWPQRTATTECVQAFHSIDPGGSPNTTTCFLYWQTLVWLANGIQGAGPDLTPAAFQQALFDVGHSFDQSPWAMGGGFGPGDYTFADSVAEVWYSSGAVDPGNGVPGAFVWTFGGKHFQRGQLPTDTSQFFRSGSPVAPET